MKEDFCLNVVGLKSLEQNSVSGSSSVQGLSQVVTEKLIKYLQQEGWCCHIYEISTQCHILVLIISTAVTTRFAKNSSSIHKTKANVKVMLKKKTKKHIFQCMKEPLFKVCQC